MTAPHYVEVYNPLGWTSSNWMAVNGDPSGSPPSRSLPAGVTIAATPAHPFAGVLGEQVLHLAAGSLIQMSDVIGHQATPDASHRWTAVCSALVYLPAYPTSEATLWSADDPHVLNVTPSGTLRLYTGSANVGGADYLAGESTALFPTGVWRQLEVCEVYRDSAGNLLNPRQWVVRVADLTPAWTELINVNANPSISTFWGYLAIALGQSSGGAAPYFPSPEMYMANVWSGWEDGDAPFGLRRQDGQRPNGIGHLNQWSGNAANVNEVLPDDATTEDTVVVSTANTAVKQLYTLTPPVYITGTDLLTASIMLGADLQCPMNTKSQTNYLSLVLSDGTTDILPTSVYNQGQWVWLLQGREGTIGKAIPWTLAALQGLQVGAEAESTTTGYEFYASTYLVSVPYARELGPALPAQIALAVPSLAYDQPSRQIWLPSRARGY